MKSRLGALLLVAAGVGLAAGAIGAWRMNKKGEQKAPAASAPGTAPRPHVAFEVANWEVIYKDVQLGEVTGHAVVNWEKKTGSVVLTDPRDGSQKHLSIAKLEVSEPDEQQVTILLTGKSPSAPAVSRPPQTGLQNIAASDEDQVAISPSVGDFKSAVKEPARPDLDTVSLSLSLDGDFGTLRGSWSYLADPLTKRDRNGSGRSGIFRMLTPDEIKDETDDPHQGFLGEQTATEEWWPLKSEIVRVVPLDNQLAFKDHKPVFAHPSRETSPRDPKRTRLLYIAGRNLPIAAGLVFQDLDALGGDDKTRYSILASTVDSNVDPANQTLLTRGWNQAFGSLDDAGKKTAQQLQGVVVSAEISDDAVPGPKELVWGGGIGQWFLQFGDNTAQARFVRPIRIGDNPAQAPELEATNAVFLPEQIAVEVVTRISLPADSIKVYVGRHGADPTPMTAHRINDATYRTDFFTVDKAGTIAATPGDQLEATVRSEDVSFVAPPAAGARVWLSPDTLAGSASKDGPVLWKEAVSVSAQCSNLSAADEGVIGHAVNKQNGPERPDQYGSEGSTYEGGIEVTVGDRAAMLILRRGFLDMMRDQLTHLGNIKSDEEMEGFREWIEPFVAGDTSSYVPPPQYPAFAADYADYLENIDAINKLMSALPRAVYGAATGQLRQPTWGETSYFGQIEVDGPEGGTLPFAHTYEYYDEEWPASIKNNPTARMAWQAKTARQVLERYLKAVANEIDSAAKIDACDTHELMKLTGVGFGAVVNHVIPRLMTLRDSGGKQTWVPDLAARSAVANLQVTAQAVLAHESYADLQGQMALIVVGGMLSAPAIITDDAAIAAYTWAANAGLIGLQTGQVIYNQLVVRQDLDQLFGASAAIGTERLDEKAAEKLDWWKTVVSIAPNLLQAQLFEAPAALRQIRIGLPGISQQLLDAVRELDLTAFRKLPPEMQQEFAACAIRAGEELREAPIASREEVEAIYQASRLAEEASPRPPPAGGVGEAPAPEGAGNDFHSRKTEISSEPGGGGNGTHSQTTKLELPPDVPVPPAVPQGEQLPPTNEPKTNSIIALREQGKTVCYKLGKRLGGGSTSQVYEILDVVDHDRSILDGDGAVIKFSHDHEQFGTAKEQMERMQYVQEVLKEANLEAAKQGVPPIEFAEALEFHPDADHPYLIQKRLKFDDNLKMVDPKDLSYQVPMKGSLDTLKKVWRPLPFDQVSAKFPSDMQEAVVRLYKQIASLGLKSTDLSLLNIYFKRTGSVWTAGILDVDHVIPVTNPKQVFTVEWVGIIEGYPWGNGIKSVSRFPRKLASPMVFMEKVFELKYGGLMQNSWIEMDKFSGQMKPNYLEPAIIKKYFPDFQDPVPVFHAPTEHEHSKLEPVFPSLRKVMDAFAEFLLPCKRGLAALRAV